MLKSYGDSLGERFSVEGGERSEGEKGVEDVDLSPSRGEQRAEGGRKKNEVSSSSKNRRRVEGENELTRSTLPKQQPAFPPP